MDVGIHSRSAYEVNQKCYIVKDIIIHQNFSALYLLNDIAILKLTTMLEENSDVAPICVTSLPTSDFYGTQCIVTGWGVTDSN